MKLQNKKIILFIILLGLFARIGFMIFFCDLKKDNYSEYGCIAKNISSGNGYSLFYYYNDSVQIKNKPFTKPYPSAFMPPGYVYYLLPFNKIDNIQLRNIFIFSSQIILSLVLIIFFYYFLSKLFSERICIISATILSLLPEFIYSAFIFNAIVHYHLFVILILIIIMDKGFTDNYKKPLLFFLLSTITIYYRSEFLLFVLLILLYLLINKKFKHFILGVFIILTLLSPWIIRNYIVFDKIIPFTTNAGLNLYRGHNPYAIGNWGSQDFSKDIHNNSDNINFELVFNKYYFNKAIESIPNNLTLELEYPFIKIFNLFVMNPDDDRSYNPLYLIPSILILLLAIIGIIKTYSISKFKFIYLFIFYSTLIVVIFFALPRYQTMMKIALIPFAAYSIDFYISKLKKSGLDKSS
jgi:hypothetical protein